MGYHPTYNPLIVTIDPNFLGHLSWEHGRFHTGHFPAPKNSPETSHRGTVEPFSHVAGDGGKLGECHDKLSYSQGGTKPAAWMSRTGS